MKMKRHIRYSWLGLALAAAGVGVVAGSLSIGGGAAATKPKRAAADAQQVELFEGMRDGRLDVTIIAKSDRAGRVLIKNKLGVPVSVKLPAAFAAVPALAQFGGGGQGGGGQGGGGGQQSGGGGFGGGGGGQGGGGGGGLFSIPPEETGKINVALVCLDHGLRNPSS